jgi:hypothetical protein
LAQSITAFNEGLVKLTPVDDALVPVRVPSLLAVIVTVTAAIFSSPTKFLYHYPINAATLLRFFFLLTPGLLLLSHDFQGRLRIDLG